MAVGVVRAAAALIVDRVEPAGLKAVSVSRAILAKHAVSAMSGTYRMVMSVYRRPQRFLTLRSLM